MQGRCIYIYIHIIVIFNIIIIISSSGITYMSSFDELQYLSIYIRTLRDSSTDLSSFYHRLLAEGVLGSGISSYEIQSTLLQGSYIGDHTRSIIGAIVREPY